jgi:hypothetical protein
MQHQPYKRQPYHNSNPFVLEFQRSNIRNCWL